MLSKGTSAITAYCCIASWIASVPNSFPALVIKFCTPGTLLKNGIALSAPLLNAPPVAYNQSDWFGASLPFLLARSKAIGPTICNPSTAAGPNNPSNGFPVAAVIPNADTAEANKLAPCSNTALSNLPQLYPSPWLFINSAVADGPSNINLSCPSFANANNSSGVSNHKDPPVNAIASKPFK